MIVNIRGTSGSGKTTAVRKLMGHADSIKPVFVQSFSSVGNRGAFNARPIGYNLSFKDLTDSIFAVGHYETPTGGGDTIRYASTIFDLIKRKHLAGYHVVFEGLILSRAKGRIIDLWESFGRDAMAVFHLTTPLEVCLQSINDRRLEKGNTTPVDPLRTKENYNRVLQISNDFRNSGHPIQFVSRDEILTEVLRTFGLTREGVEDVRPYSPESA